MVIQVESSDLARVPSLESALNASVVGCHDRRARRFVAEAQKMSHLMQDDCWHIIGCDRVSIKRKTGSEIAIVKNDISVGQVDIGTEAVITADNAKVLGDR